MVSSTLLPLVIRKLWTEPAFHDDDAAYQFSVPYREAPTVQVPAYDARPSLPTTQNWQVVPEGTPLTCTRMAVPQAVGE